MDTTIEVTANGADKSAAAKAVKAAAPKGKATKAAAPKGKTAAPKATKAAPKGKATKAAAPKGKTAAPKATKAAPNKGETARARYAGDEVIKLTKTGLENPRRKGTGQFDDYALIMKCNGKTLDEFKNKGGKLTAIHYAVAGGYVDVR